MNKNKNNSIVICRGVAACALVSMQMCVFSGDGEEN